ncbi:MAG: hypothetical protein Q9210_000741 [Variospora velana]
MTTGMNPPPAKRRRRVVVPNAGVDGDKLPSLEVKGKQPGSLAPKSAPNSIGKHHTSHQIVTARLRSKQKPIVETSKPPSVGWSPPISPEKKPKAKSINVRKTAKPTALDTYFSANRNLQNASSSAKQTRTLETAIEQEDSIEDDSLDDELCRLSNPRTAQRLGNDDGDVIAPYGSAAGQGVSGSLPTGSQVFRRLGDDVLKKETDQTAAGLRTDGTRPWADRYGPTCIEELAVHKKKVADVRDWLDTVCAGRSNKKLLVLKGASGVGKTATVSALAKLMDLDILEWKNPMVSDISTDTYVSTSAQFDDFLGRSGKFTSLNFARSEGTTASDGLFAPQEVDSESRKKLVLIEEFPNIFMSSSTSLQSFRASILRYLADSQAYAYEAVSNTDEPTRSAMPLVMIVSENQVNSALSVDDSFTAYRLLGAEILSHPSTEIIEFNSIAPTYITKALNLVIQKEARDSGRRRVPSPSVLSRLSEVGDVRSAVGSLEFLCLRNQDSADWGGRVSSKGRKGAKHAAVLTKMEEESLEIVTQREASLGLFHAVGKIVYNKREGPGEGKSAIGAPTQPPKHLRQHIRRNAPDVVVDHLANETGTDTQTFIAALHENYVLSCAGSGFLDTLNACIEHLSDTDFIISEKGEGRYRGSNSYFHGAAIDSLRQDEIAFQVAARGLLFGLPWPVKRGGLPPQGRSGGKGDAFKMFYPTSMRLKRQAAEIEECVGRWMIRWRGGSASSSARTASGDQEDGVARWAQRPSAAGGRDDGADDISPTVTPSKDVMLLETLPYTALIERHRSGSLLVEELTWITRVTGEARPATEESSDEMDMQKCPPMDVVPNARAVVLQASAALPSSAAAVEQAVGHLYLCDDDIED